MCIRDRTTTTTTINNKIVTLPSIASQHRDNTVLTVAHLQRQCYHCDAMLGRRLIRGAKVYFWRVAAGAGGDATGGDGGGVNLFLGGLGANLRCSMRNRKGCAWLKAGGLCSNFELKKPILRIWFGDGGGAAF